MENLKLKIFWNAGGKSLYFGLGEDFLATTLKAPSIKAQTNKLALIQISNPCCKDTIQRMNKLQENTFNSHTWRWTCIQMRWKTLKTVRKPNFKEMKDLNRYLIKDDIWMANEWKVLHTTRHWRDANQDRSARACGFGQDRNPHDSKLVRTQRTPPFAAAWQTGWQCLTKSMCTYRRNQWSLS